MSKEIAKLLKIKKPLDDFFKNHPLIKKIKKGVPIVARVICIKNKFVILDSNLKSESYVDIREFYNSKKELEVKKGTYIVVLIESVDNGWGHPVLSRKKFKESYIWKYFVHVLKMRINIKGKIVNKIKGGFSVMIRDIKCFLPYSATDKRVLLNMKHYENKTILFRIIKINLKKKNIVLSRKLVYKSVLNKKKISLFKQLVPGKIIKGIVRNMMYYCAVISFGYFNGIVLAKNITWGPNKYPNESLKINQSVVTKILRIDKEKNRVYLGIKQLTRDPWKNVFSKYKVGNVKYVRIYRITNDSVHFLFEKGIYSYMKKYKILKLPRGKFIINNIKVNSYIKVIISNISTRGRFILFTIPYIQFCP